MGYLFSGAFFTVVSVVVMLIMARVTNNRIKNLSQDDAAAIVPYKVSFINYTLLMSAAAASALCGGLIWEYAISGVAFVKLAICYFAALAAAVIDHKTRIIPNFIAIILIGAKVLIFLYECIFLDGTLSGLFSSLLGCLICSVLLLLSNKFSKGGIGGGDIKLLAAMCLLCGVFVVFTIMVLALLCCCLVAVVGIVRKKITLKNSVPFGPYIYLGYVLMCVFSLY